MRERPADISDASFRSSTSDPTAINISPASLAQLLGRPEGKARCIAASCRLTADKNRIFVAATSSNNFAIEGDLWIVFVARKTRRCTKSTRFPANDRCLSAFSSEILFRDGKRQCDHCSHASTLVRG